MNIPDYPTGSHLGLLIRAARTGRGARRVDLVRSLGIVNVNKGIRTLAALEEEGRFRMDFLRKVAVELGLDWAVLREAHARDTRERTETIDRYLDTPETPKLYLIAAGVPCRLSLPESLQTPLAPDVSSYPELEAFARSNVARIGGRCWLVLNRRWTVWFQRTEEGIASGRFRSTAENFAERFPMARLSKSRGSGFSFG